MRTMAERTSPLQNRVTPEGDIVALTARGLLMGNRGGRLHRPDFSLGRRRWSSRQWIACKLAFNGRQRQIMGPASYTELFFLDEATALAAGHRPCFECRRQDFLQFATLWASALGLPQARATAAAMDARLHDERLCADGSKRTVSAPLDGLPEGTFVRLAGRPHLVVRDRLVVWQPGGYGPVAGPQPRPDVVEVLTPAAIVSVLKAGYACGLHPSARDAAAATDRSRQP